MDTLHFKETSSILNRNNPSHTTREHQIILHENGKIQRMILHICMSSILGMIMLVSIDDSVQFGILIKIYLLCTAVIRSTDRFNFNQFDNLTESNICLAYACFTVSVIVRHITYSRPVAIIFVRG